ncbi:MAG: class I SAM-dependent methyltransferase [Rhodothermales bacterium]|nr:class I SAM-dependent methyltransferase [Rhodothermales bacterium]
MSDDEYRPLVWNDDTIARFWRWQARYPEQYFAYQFGDRIAHGLRRYIDQGRRVLDYGCGMGFLSRHLTAFGADVWATDVSLDAVEATNARNRGVAGFHGARTLDEASASPERFDRILSVEVIEHLDDEKLDEFFRRLRELLEPDGIVVITTPNEENLEASEVYCPCCEHVFHRWQHVRSFTSATLKERVVENGLTVMETYVTDFSRRGISGAVASIKSGAKKLIGRREHLPHLVCVATNR